jgi:hypothetical protein
MLKMKQTSKKGFSSRSTGTVSKQGVPSKSSKAKVNLDSWSKTPIRVGIDENINSCIATSSDLIAKLHLHYRSSVHGRKELSKAIATSLKKLSKLKNRPEFKNRNIEILQAYLKCLGYKLVFESEEHQILFSDGDVKTAEASDGKLFLGSEKEFDNYERTLQLKKKYPIFQGSRKQYENYIQKKIVEQKELEKKLVIQYTDMEKDREENS